MAIIDINEGDAAESDCRNSGTRGHEAGDTAEDFEVEIKGRRRATTRRKTDPDMASSWAGQPHIKGSSESLRMALLTFSLIGLQ